MSNEEKENNVDHMEKGDYYVENGKLMVHGHEVSGLALIMGDVTKNQGRMIGLFALLVIISGNFLGDLFPKQVRNILDNNVYMKHIFAFMTLVFFVFLTMPEIQLQGVSIVFGIYFLFLMTSKLKPFTWFSLVFLIALLYLLEIREEKLIKYYEKNKDNIEGKQDMTSITIIDNWIRPGAVLSVFGIGIYGAIGIIKKYYNKSSKKSGFFRFLFSNEQ
jgi:hypothetical protein